MATMLNGVVPLTVMRFASANARSAAFTGSIQPVPGMITYLIAENRWEGRQADGTWLLLSDGPWQPLTFVNSHSAQGGSPGWRRKAGGGIELRGRFKANSGKLVDGGDLVKFSSIPVAVAPAASRIFLVATTRSTSDGLSKMTARVQVMSNGDLIYFCEAGGGQGTIADPSWVALDGIQFSPAGD
jgi:hypothetical protein